MLLLKQSLILFAAATACGKNDDQPNDEPASKSSDNLTESNTQGAVPTKDGVCLGMKISQEHYDRVSKRFYLLGLPNGYTTASEISIVAGGEELANFAYHVGPGDSSICKTVAKNPGLAGEPIAFSDAANGRKVLCFDATMKDGKKKAIHFSWEKVTQDSALEPSMHKCLATTANGDEAFQSVRWSSEQSVAVLGLNGNYGVGLDGTSWEQPFGKFGEVADGGSMVLDASQNLYSSAVTFRGIFGSTADAPAPRLYVTKYSPTGERAWFKTLDLPAEVQRFPTATKMAFDGTHIYVAIGASLVSEVMGPVPGGHTAIRIVKLTLDGDIVLDRSVPVGPQAKTGGLAFASDGSLVLTVSSTITFYKETTLDYKDIAIALLKLSPQLEITTNISLSAFRVEHGWRSHMLTAPRVDAADNTVVYWHESPERILSGAPRLDYFAKFDSTGTELWRAPVNGENASTLTKAESVRDFVLSADGKTIYATGSVAVSEMQIADHLLNDSDVMLMALSATDGSLQWLRHWESLFTDEGLSIDRNAAGKLVVAGVDDPGGGNEHGFIMVVDPATP